jgi:uncharacterized tellurite resistance protein B-like protein
VSNQTHTKDGSPGADTLHRISDALDDLDQERARFIASFAYTLSRVAHADMDISAEEIDAMIEIVTEHGQVSQREAILVVEMAKEHTVLFGATQDFLVTRAFVEKADRDQKLALLDCLFAVSAADHIISAEEEQEIKNISNEMNLSHKDYISTRLGYRNKLSIFKEPESQDS